MSLSGFKMGCNLTRRTAICVIKGGKGGGRPPIDTLSPTLAPLLAWKIAPPIRVKKGRIAPL